MAALRMIAEGGGCYHCISRVVDRQFIFGPEEKDYFVASMRRLEAFLGVKVLTYCVMSNHFHLLVEVPDADARVPLTEESLLERLPLLYRGGALVVARDEIARASAAARSGGGSATWIEAILSRYQARMGDLSVFIKELKWRFSVWYNMRSQRVGTLWEDRFRSVLVEGDEHALMTMAAYIELNPVRAGLVDDPKDYRWCGYGEAVAGKSLARRRLARMHGRTRAWQGVGRVALSWREVAPAYRIHLFGHGERRQGDGLTGRGKKPGIDPERVKRVIVEQGGKLPLHELLQCRVRYLSDGAVVGSRGFVDGFFETHRDRFGQRRKGGGRSMRGADWGGLTVLRDLRKDVFG